MNTSNTTARKVLVVGATGAMGRPVVHLLRQRGVAVRALCRRPDAAADLAALGAEVVAGDLTDPNSLQRACRGSTCVLAAAHSLLGRGRWRSEAVDDEGHRALIGAARDAGVERFVYTSGRGAGPDHPVDFFRTKHRIEQVLKASGLQWVVLRPTAFMEQHVHQFNGQGLLTGGRIRMIGPGNKRRNFIAATDVAQVAVRALLEELPPFSSIDIAGRDGASNLEVAALYAQLSGRPLRVSHLPRAMARTISFAARPLHPGLARLMGMLSLPDDAFVEDWDDGAALEREHGVTTTRLEDFVRARVVEAGIAPAAAPATPRPPAG